MTWTAGAAEQGDEADEAFGGTNPRAASGARPEVPPHARAGRVGRGHRFAAYPRCSADHVGGSVSATRARAARLARAFLRGELSGHELALICTSTWADEEPLIQQLVRIAEREPLGHGMA